MQTSNHGITQPSAFPSIIRNACVCGCVRVCVCVCDIRNPVHMGRPQPASEKVAAAASGCSTVREDTATSGCSTVREDTATSAAVSGAGVRAEKTQRGGEREREGWRNRERERDDVLQWSLFESEGSSGVAWTGQCLQWALPPSCPCMAL